MKKTSCFCELIGRCRCQHKRRDPRFPITEDRYVEAARAFTHSALTDITGLYVS